MRLPQALLIAMPLLRFKHRQFGQACGLENPVSLFMVINFVTGSLKTLIMMRCPRVSESEFASIGRRLPQLQSLQLSVCSVRLNSLRTFPNNPIASSMREIVFME